jgi:hypothetical protein
MVLYTAVVIDTKQVIDRFGQQHENLYSHHSTIEFKPSSIEGLEIGKVVNMPILGRLTTDKVDVLWVDNPYSKNEYPHITLSTAEGVKPFESNSELKKYIDQVKPVTGSIKGVIQAIK